MGHTNKIPTILMTQLTKIRIRGFKAIEEMEVEPSHINLITGRNNTGKTSFMEAIDLTFNPGNLTKFESKVNKLINNNKSSTSIICEFVKAQMTLDDFINDGDPGKDQREVRIRRPSDGEAAEIFFKSLRDILDINKKYPIRFSEGWLSEFSDINESNAGMSSEEIQERFQDALEESVSGLSEEYVVEHVGDNCIILSISNKEYPYIYIGDYYSQIRERIANQAIEQFLPEKWHEGDGPDEDERVQHNLRRILDSMLAPRFGRGRFVLEPPAPIEGLELIKSVKAIPETMDLNQENSGIWISDIEDYLKKNNVVENLDDFSFDSVVYKENGEKNEVPYAFMGEGFKTVVGVLWELYSAERAGDILMMEEPDIHMHPGYIDNLVRQLIEISRSENLQLFITTHNVDFIKSFFSPIIKDDTSDYLEDNFKLIQMTEPVPRVLNYQSSQEEMEDLQLDLRGP